MEKAHEKAHEKDEKKWITITTIMLYITVIWNVFEGGSSIYFGYNTNDISLFAFGIDSLIEVLSASLVLYHMTCTSLPSLTLTNNNNLNRSSLFTLEIERKLTIFIGSLLVLFCIFSCVGGGFRIYEQIPPSSTKFGIIIGGICISAMFIMWYFKTKASIKLNSSTLASDAACSLGCVTLSAMLCIGSILYQIWPNLWWVDAVTVIIIGLYVGYEGLKTVKHAKDVKNFKGGCGCCGGGGAGAANSGLAKYLKLGQNNSQSNESQKTVNTKSLSKQAKEATQLKQSVKKQCGKGCDDCCIINNNNNNNNNNVCCDDADFDGCCHNECCSDDCCAVYSEDNDDCCNDNGGGDDCCNNNCCDDKNTSNNSNNNSNNESVIDIINIMDMVNDINNVDECVNGCCTEKQTIKSYGTIDNNKNNKISCNGGNGDCCSH